MLSQSYNPYYPYLLRKFVFFDNSEYFIIVIDCSVGVSQSFIRGAAAPLPPGCYTYDYMVTNHQFLNIV